MRVSQAEINKAAWGACDTFRGVVDPSIYKDYVLTMLFLKYISDVWKDHYDKFVAEHGDEPDLIAALMENEAFVLPDGASFYALYEQRHQPANGERIDKALSAIEEANGAKLRDVFQDISFNSNKLGDEQQKNDILRHLLEDFAKDALNLRPSRVGNLDVIGGAYEYLISRFAATAGKKAGEFYTPAEVSELMAELVDPQEGDEICDPTCGSGSLLMKCGRQISQKIGKKAYALYGQEAIGSTWALAKMNMFLHGETNHQIEWGDTIRNPKLRTKEDTLRKFDVVVANPPFSLEKWGIEQAEKDPFKRFSRGLPPKTKGDYAFITHMVETLKENTGRMAVVVPHGVLFRGSSEGKIRTALIEENLLDAVIGLPEKLFFGTGIPAAVLVFKKNKADDTVLFIDASREYVEGTNQNQLSEAHIAKIVAAYKARETADKYAYVASLDEVKENDYNLNIPRYVDTFEEEEEIDLMTVRQEREELKAEMSELEAKMDAYLKELGYGS
ncbi:type I restriction-modification system subunit M [Rhodobacteraceae bacterium RKSG542]|uniref:type I restriction-modification system subunit M n=1 Tax=Pseudovibrio flavus TaxID=2529854 RepID=UPI0012BD096A|nr:type I restriction-modification system subunit M [Pseudovibrio flavus]MTI17431.1 type I restriction-modification system subunit M [Pseudovibrio flavus]